MKIIDIIESIEAELPTGLHPSENDARLTLVCQVMRDMLHDLETSEDLQVETLTNIFPLKHASLKKEY